MDYQQNSVKKKFYGTRKNGVVGLTCHTLKKADGIFLLYIIYNFSSLAFTLDEHMEEKVLYEAEVVVNFTRFCNRQKKGVPNFWKPLLRVLMLGKLKKY